MRVQVANSIKARKLLLLGVISLSAALKVCYALSRDIFESGPDANSYIPFALGFAENNFFSSDIPGPPFYPSGYPFILSLLARVAPQNWFELSQLLQIGMFSLASYCFYYLVERMFSWKIAGVATLILCLNPAWAVVNSEAMYETLLVSFLIFSIYFLLSPRQKSENYTVATLVRGGALGGIAIAIHPRVLPLLMIIYVVFFLTRLKSFSKGMALAGSTIVVPVFFAMRNLRAKGDFTLMNSFWNGAQALNAFLSGCNSNACAAERIIASPIGFLEQSFNNGIGFWSPHSGPLMKGTWYHNISVLSYLNGHGYNTVSIYISLIFSISIFLTWIYGTMLLHKQNRFYNALLFSLGGTIWLTDILVYGENRHRLVALIFMLPAHSACALELYKKISFGNGKNSIRKANF